MGLYMSAIHKAKKISKATKKLINKKRQNSSRELLAILKDTPICEKMKIQNDPSNEGNTSTR